MVLPRLVKMLPALALCSLAAEAAHAGAREGETAAEESAMLVTFLGTGAPRPSEKRYGPSFLVEAGRHRLLVDAGWGVRERLFQAGGFELIAGIDHVLVTHLHFDHTLGLPDIWLTGWLYGRRVPLRVQGPPGTVDMLENLRSAFKWDTDYRTIVGVPAAGVRVLVEDIEPGVVYERGDLKVTAFPVEHLPIDLQSRRTVGFRGETLGFRVDYRGRSIVFSGDTRPSAAVVEHGRGVDLLIHEVQVPSPGTSKEAKLANVSLSVHSTPEQAAGVFAKARPRVAIYAHIIPPETTAAALLEETRKHYKGRVEVAEDLMTIRVGDRIDVVQRPEQGSAKFEESRVLD